MQREEQGQYIAKLLDIPKEASEVLLLWCLRSKGAKAVYIPYNRNKNQKKFAIITFASVQELETAQTTPIWYNNHRVSWENPQRKDLQWKEESRGRRKEWSKTRDQSQEESEIRRKKQKTRRKAKTKRSSSIQTQEIESGLENISRNEEEEQRIKKQEREDGAQLQRKSLHVEDILCRILDRLDRLEEIRGLAGKDPANRSWKSLQLN
jgi:hypothetical protein